MAGIHFLDAKGPDGIRVYAVGDVHGRRDLIEAMHDRIGEEIARDGVADWRIVHLGDYVDRGPDTAGVLDFLTSRIAGEPRIVALAGNHDVALVDFLAHGDRTQMFRRFGGNDTARSYGTHVDFATAATAEAGRQALARAMPQAHLDFLSGLPRAVAFGDFFFCHAGIRPSVPLERQDLEHLIGIREPFLSHPGLHPKVIVHGHTPHDEAELMPNRVDLDTLAYASGRLTALAVDGRTKRLLEVSG